MCRLPLSAAACLVGFLLSLVVVTKVFCWVRRNTHEFLKVKTQTKTARHSLKLTGYFRELKDYTFHVIP